MYSIFQSNVGNFCHLKITIKRYFDATIELDLVILTFFVLEQNKVRGFSETRLTSLQGHFAGLKPGCGASSPTPSV